VASASMRARCDAALGQRGSEAKSHDILVTKLPSRYDLVPKYDVISRNVYASRPHHVTKASTTTWNGYFIVLNFITSHSYSNFHVI